VQLRLKPVDFLRYTEDMSHFLVVVGKKLGAFKVLPRVASSNLDFMRLWGLYLVFVYNIKIKGLSRSYACDRDELMPTCRYTTRYLIGVNVFGCLSTFHSE
jgi:hypothetical protein